MTKSLENKLALVTGASRGIGAAIALRLARDGAYVIVHYSTNAAKALEVVSQIKKSGGHAESVAADLSTKDGPAIVNAFIDTAFGGQFEGRLDILVNNAGVVSFGSFVDSSDDSYEYLFNVNVRSPIEITKKVAKSMIAAKSGRIINIGSMVGESIGFPGATMYAASKFALQGFTRGLSRELGQFGITVNNVQPGPIQTDMAPTGPAHEAFVKLTSVGRFGTAEEVASAVAFLANPESAFINGESLTVDGGVNA